MNSFDPVKHEYTVGGRRVPSVTQIIGEVLPDSTFHAGEWYLQRGRAVHACAAMIAQGKTIRHDPAIDGQVQACRRFFWASRPEVLEVEQQVYNTTYNYAGTFDLMAVIQGKTVILDWKSSASPAAEIQIGAYALCRPKARYGMVVELHEDGSCKCSEMFKTERGKREFLAVRSVYSIRERLGLLKGKSNE